MNTNIIEAREFIAKAREALKGGDKETARDLGEKAASSHLTSKMPGWC